MAVVVNWESRKVTIDRSGMVANGIFAGLERVRQLRQDEDELLTMLGVEEDRG